MRQVEDVGRHGVRPIFDLIQDRIPGGQKIAPATALPIAISTSPHKTTPNPMFIGSSLSGCGSYESVCPYIVILPLVMFPEDDKILTPVMAVCPFQTPAPVTASITVAPERAAYPLNVIALLLAVPDGV